MNKHLKFRRLIAESLEKRQLFAADLFFGFETWTGSSSVHALADFGQYDQASESQSETSADSSDCDDFDSTLNQLTSGSNNVNLSANSDLLIFSFRKEFGGHHGRDRMLGEGENSHTPPPKPQESFGGMSSGSSSLSSGGLNSAGPATGLSPSVSANQLGLSSPSATTSGQASSTTPPRPIDDGGIKYASTSLGTSPVSSSNSGSSLNQPPLNLTAPNQIGSTNKPESVEASNSGSTTIIIAIRGGEPTNSGTQSRANSLPSSQFNSNPPSVASNISKQFTAADLGVNSSTADRNSSVVQQSIQQQHNSNIRSLQTYLNSSSESSSSIRGSNQDNTTASLGSKSSSLSDQSIASGLNRETGSDSIVRSGATTASRDEAFEDDLLGDAALSNRLSMNSKPWKISDSSLSSLRKLSKTTEVTASDAASSNDLVIAGLFEDGGFAEIDLRRNPIARIEQPWNVVQASVRLESKVGAFRVFDVIDEDTPAAIAEVNRPLGFDNSLQLEFASADTMAIKPQADEFETPTKSSLNKPLFLTTVLAVFSGRLLRSRRKQIERDLPNGSKCVN